MSRSTGNTEPELVIAHAERVANALELIGDREVAKFLGHVVGLTRAGLAAAPERFATRDLLVAYFAGVAADMEERTRLPSAPPGAERGCAPFVSVLRQLSAAIGTGAHMPGGPDVGTVAAVVAVMGAEEPTSRSGGVT